MNEKILKNVLITEKLYKISKEERKEILTTLLKTNSERGLAKELGIPHSTLHDWVTVRQNNTEKGIHISLNQFYLKINALIPEDINDWGRLEMIKEKCEELLRGRK